MLLDILISNICNKFDWLVEYAEKITGKCIDWDSNGKPFIRSATQ